MCFVCLFLRNCFAKLRNNSENLNDKSEILLWKICYSQIICTFANRFRSSYLLLTVTPVVRRRAFRLRRRTVTEWAALCFLSAVNFLSADGVPDRNNYLIY